MKRYPDLIVKDFDSFSNYEETILKVMNEYTKLGITDPPESS